MNIKENSEDNQDDFEELKEFSFSNKQIEFDFRDYFDLVDEESENEELINQIKEENPQEIDKQEDMVAVEILTKVADMITKEHDIKCKHRRTLIFCFFVYFCVVTVLIFGVVIDPLNRGYHVSISLALLGGLFANLIGLFVIIFKYAFSSTTEIYDFALNVFQHKGEYIRKVKKEDS